MNKSSKGKNVFFSIVAFVLGFIASFLFVAPSILKPVGNFNATDLEINFMMLGNKFNGDSIYIKAGEVDILVDAGSKASSAKTIKDYIFDSTSNHAYVADNKLEYVIATHGHEDHIAAFAGNSDGILLDENIEIGTIIEFPKTEVTSNVYENYRQAVDNLEAKGTNVYTALECYNNENGAQRIIELSEGIKLEILYNYYYENDASKENNYSVCFMLRRGNEQYLFTGDLESGGEELLTEYNNLGEVYLYKMGHHGSETSSSDELLKVIKPKVVVGTCVAFRKEYNTEQKNLFPAQRVISTLASVGTVEHFYVTNMVASDGDTAVAANGNIVVKANSKGTYVECSETNEDFFNFEVFKKYRSWTTN